MSTFWEKLSNSLAKKTVKGTGQCILWTGTTDHDGYGVKRVKWPNGVQKLERVHRVAYMVKAKLVLPRTDASSGQLLEVSHLCHNRLCVNPDHLVAEVHCINMSRIHCHYTGACSLEHCPPCIFF